MHKQTKIGIKIEISAPDIILQNKISLFERELIGFKALSANEITSRVDSMLSAANTIASLQAVENAFGITPSKQTKIIRELILRNELVFSHINHLCKRIIPHLYGEKDYFSFIKKQEKEYKKGSDVVQTLQRVMDILGKKYPHPINIAVGGHLILISEDEKKEILNLLKEIIPFIVKSAEFISKNQKTSLEIIDSYSCLWDLDTTPLIGGKIKENDSEPKTIDDFYANFNAGTYSFVGPISRLNQNRKLLSFNAEKMVKKYNIKFPITNIYQASLAFLIEAVHFIERSIEELTSLNFENETIPIFNVKEGKGYSCVESAKGTIYHYFEIGSDGRIEKARIILPFEQNERFLKKAIKSLPLDFDRKTRSQMLEEIDYLIDMFYL